jgi:transcriptional regulator with XRE-family HTH domain
MIQSYVRMNVDSVEGLFSAMSSRASMLGSTTRAQRAALYGMSESSLSALESGSRVPTADEKAEILDAFTVLGMSLYPEDLDVLPAAQP